MSPYDELKAECADLQRKVDLVLVHRENLRNYLSSFMSLSEQIMTMHHNIEVSMKEFKAILTFIEDRERARKAHLENVRKQLNGWENHIYPPPFFKEYKLQGEACSVTKSGISSRSRRSAWRIWSCGSFLSPGGTRH